MECQKGFKKILVDFDLETNDSAKEKMSRKTVGGILNNSTTRPPIDVKVPDIHKQAANRYK